MKVLNGFKIFVLLFSIYTNTQVEIGAPTPHKDADVHLANKNKTLLLNHVDEKTALTDPQSGMFFYDTQDGCFVVMPTVSLQIFLFMKQVLLIGE